MHAFAPVSKTILTFRLDAVTTVDRPISFVIKELVSAATFTITEWIGSLVVLVLTCTTSLEGCGKSLMNHSC